MIFVVVLFLFYSEIKISYICGGQRGFKKRDQMKNIYMKMKTAILAVITSIS